MHKAIFLGSFNPPHKGHVNCVKSVIESNIMNELNINKIHIIPCWQNPNKSKSISFYDRYNMCKYEFASLSNICLVDDIESIIKPTYTYELIDYFKSNKDKIIDNEFWWIITVETINELINNKWKESERLLKENKFIIVTKNSINIDIDEYCKKNNISIKWVMLNDNGIDTHSTQIRENFWVNTKYDDCISENTKNYIIEHNIYK